MIVYVFGAHTLVALKACMVWCKAVKLVTLHPSEGEDNQDQKICGEKVGDYSEM